MLDDMKKKKNQCYFRDQRVRKHGNWYILCLRAIHCCTVLLIEPCINTAEKYIHVDEWLWIIFLLNKLWLNIYVTSPVHTKIKSISSLTDSVKLIFINLRVEKDTFHYETQEGNWLMNGGRNLPSYRILKKDS